MKFNKNPSNWAPRFLRTSGQTEGQLHRVTYTKFELEVFHPEGVVK